MRELGYQIYALQVHHEDFITASKFKSVEKKKESSHTKQNKAIETKNDSKERRKNREWQKNL